VREGKRTVLATRRESKRTRQADRDEDGSTGTELRRGHGCKAREIQNKVVSIMADRGLRSVRRALLFAYQANVIDAVEFAGKTSLRNFFPFWKFERFNFDDWDDTECRTELNLLLEALQLPDRFVSS